MAGKSVKMKKVGKIVGGLMRDDLKAKERPFVFDPLLNR